jgi:putative salt-induced outer membrane protein
MIYKNVRILALLAFVTTSLCLSAEDRAFQLANGDRVSGKVVSENEETITLEHPLLGTIQLSRQALASTAPATASTPAAAATPAETAAPLPEEKEVLPFLTLPKDWSGQLRFGNAWQSGRSKKTGWDLHGDLTVDKAPNEYKYSAFYRYEETDDNVSTDRWGFGFRYRRDLAPNTFLQAQSTYDVDTLKAIDSQFIQSLGYGFRLIDREDLHVNLIPGVAYEYLSQRNASSQNNFLFVLSQDLDWRINERFSFKQHFNAYYNPDRTNEYRFLFKSGIIGDITKTLKLDVSYEYEYDNGVEAGIKKFDSRLTSALIIAF